MLRLLGANLTTYDFLTREGGWIVKSDGNKAKVKSFRLESAHISSNNINERLEFCLLRLGMAANNFNKEKVYDSLIKLINDSYDMI